MYPSEVTHPSPSTTLQVEKQLSMLYRTFRVIMKPMRSQLANFGKKYPAGSPKLSPPKRKNGCTITERQEPSTGIWQYDFRVDGVQSPVRNVVLYFAGGGFQAPPLGEHWDMIGRIAKQLSDKYAFTIVSAPLAPHCPASECLPVLRKYLRAVCEEAARDGRTVTLMGDSSGGNLTLSLGFWWAEEVGQGSSLNSTVNPPITDDTNTKLRSVMKGLVVIAPAVDHRNTNPEIRVVDHHDPLLGYNLIESVSQAWTAAPPGKPEGTSSRTDPKISPLLHPPSAYRLLKELGIKVHGLIGTYDALAPDAELFRRKCVEFDVGGDWLVWEGQMHCFVLAGKYHLSEGMHGVDWLTKMLDRNA